MPSPHLRIQTDIRNVHLWVGLVVGLLFSLMSLSCSLIEFRADIEHALRPRWPSASPARPQAILTEAAQDIRRRWPGARIVSLNIPPGAAGPNVGAPYEFDARLADGRTAHIFIDSRSGEVLGTFDLPWLSWIVDLHHNLRLGSAGKQAVGVIGLALFFPSLTGLPLWTLRKPNWRTALRVRTRTSWKLANFDLHRSTGLVANALLLTVSITGIYLAYP